MKRLEEEIKQTNFKSEYHKLVLNIFFTNNWLQAKFEDLFKSYNITPQQYNILRILRGQHPKPCTINLLIERMINKMCDASRLVEKLRVKGLLERIQCPSDRRAVNVMITPKGLQLLTDLDPIMEEIYGKITKNLTSEEAQGVNLLLDKFRQ